MLNLRNEGLNIINILRNKGYKSQFIGNYPFVRYNNLVHQDDKLPINKIEIATEAPKQIVCDLFDVYEIEDNFNKSLLINVIIGKHKLHFRIYYKENYITKTNKEIKINTLNDIIKNFNCNIETLTLNKKMKYQNFINKKFNTEQDIENKEITINGSLKTNIFISPIRILQLIHYYSNLNYTLSKSIINTINNNIDLLQNETQEKIIKYVNLIIMSKYASKGLMLLKKCFMNITYTKSFDFFKSISNDNILFFDNFNKKNDLISRWTFLLKNLDYNNILNNLNMTINNKIIWSIEHIKDLNNNYKDNIYNNKSTLIYVNKKYNVFTLYEMYHRLILLLIKIDKDNEKLYNNIYITLCSRPFFKEQCKYTDKFICALANKDKGEWVNNIKEHVVYQILKMNKHPYEREYIQIIQDNIKNILNIDTEKNNNVNINEIVKNSR